MYVVYMPEKPPSSTESSDNWPVKVGDNVMLRDTIPEAVKNGLLPHFRVNREYKVLEIHPADTEGPVRLYLESESGEWYPIAKAHLRPTQPH